MKTFKFRESLKNVWGIYKNNWEIILIAFVATLIISLIIPARWFVLSVIVSAILGVVMTKLWIILFEEKQADIVDLKFTSAQAIEITKSTLLFIVVSFGAILLIGIISGIALLAGFLVGLLVQLAAPWVLGFVFAGIVGFVLFIWTVIRASFISIHIVKNADHKGPWNTIKQGWNITKGHIGSILVFSIKTTLLNILGLICLVIGLLVTVPLSNIMRIDLYHKLVSKRSHVE